MKMSYSGAIYLRLSREDGIGESESIASQRMLLMQYAEKNGIPVCAEFTDDGISGSKWERSGFQQMLRAIEDGWINLVLVKDLSRLSRDYIRTGELIERWFPAHGTRLIAVNDGLDTDEKNMTNDYSAIRAVMDDWYARDISHKVRAAIRARQNAGICTAAQLPYGYCRSNRSIVISEEKAQIVRSIFRDYCLGESCCCISQNLTQKQIGAPGGKGRIWYDATVRRILTNSAYIGKLQLHSTETYSYKCGKRRRLSAEDIVEYPVPPIVTETEYLMAKNRLAQHAHHRKTAHPLSGKAVCGNCGENMYFVSEKTDIRLICGGRKRGNGCCNPSVLLSDLLSMISDALKERGVFVRIELVPMLIGNIRIGTDCVDVDLPYALPLD